MDKSNVLEWNSNFTLKWSDFQAESNPAVFEDSHSVIKYRFTWTVNSDNIDGQIVFLIGDISIFAEFHPLLSWVRPSNANDQLLYHEQGNFDLAELVKRENISQLQESLYNKPFPTRGKHEEQRRQFAKEDSGIMIQKKAEHLQKIFDEKSTKYHIETNYGANIEVQSKYDALYKKLHL